MDLFSGAPAVRGFGAHLALMIAGVAGVAIGRLVWGRSQGPTMRPDADRDGIVADPSAVAGSEGRQPLKNQRLDTGLNGPKRAFTGTASVVLSV